MAYDILKNCTIFGGYLMLEFLPEGFNSSENFFSSEAALLQAQSLGKILEAKAIMCDSEHNLIIDLGFAKGIIPKNESALELNGEKVKDIAIISRVNKMVCFKVLKVEKDNNNKVGIVLSRRLAQKLCFENKILKLYPGDVIDAIVTHLENFGAFVDIGCGIVSHPNERFKNGMRIKVIVKSILKDRINLTHKELLGTWEENSSQFDIGETVSGIVRSIEDYGIFVELTPNLAGLAEPREGIKIGQQISVYIKNIIPEKMKIKLVIIESFDSKPKVLAPKYFFNEPHMCKFTYSPASCKKTIETDFSKSWVKV